MYTLDFMGVPLHDDELIQFKIKPVHANDTVKLELKKADDTYVTLFDTAAFTTAAKGKALSPAYKQALVEESGDLTGWYQFSIAAGVDSKQLRVTLKCGNGNFISGEDVIGMDDLTIGYASTLGWLKFSSDKASAQRESGEALYKFYTED